MTFEDTQIQEYLARLPEELREGASKMLRNPQDMENLLIAHKKANQEAMERRLFIESALPELTSDEIEQVIEQVNYINENPNDAEQIKDRFFEVFDESGGYNAINSGELDPEDVGLIMDEETGELDVDLDDGETYIDDDGYLVDGNGFYIDEDGEYTDEPVHEQELEDYEASLIERQIQDETDTIRAEFEEKQRLLEVERQLLRDGINPDYIDDMKGLYRPPEDADENEIEGYKNSFRSKYPQAFGQAQNNNAVYVDTSRVGGNTAQTSSAQARYEQAKANKDFDAMTQARIEMVKEASARGVTQAPTPQSTPPAQSPITQTQ